MRLYCILCLVLFTLDIQCEMDNEVDVLLSELLEQNVLFPDLSLKKDESPTDKYLKAKDIVKQILAKKWNVSLVLEALRNRENIELYAWEELRSLNAGEGFVKGLSTILMIDPHRELKVLTSNDYVAQKTLLVCARLLEEKLPLEKVIALIKKNPQNEQLVKMAKSYIEKEGSSEAGEFLKEYEFFTKILGLRDQNDTWLRSFSDFDNQEKKLLNETMVQPELEIYALLSCGYPRNKGQRIIRIQNTKAILYLYDDSDRYYYRELSNEELEEFRDFIHQNDIDALPPHNRDMLHGTMYEYVHIYQQQGRRVFMENPIVYPEVSWASQRKNIHKKNIHNLLATYFVSMTKDKEMHAHYADPTNPQKSKRDD